MEWLTWFFASELNAWEPSSRWVSGGVDATQQSGRIVARTEVGFHPISGAAARRVALAHVEAGDGYPDTADTSWDENTKELGAIPVSIRCIGTHV
jgi:hypothetical protein